MPERLIIAGRKSLLARVQVYNVIHSLRQIYPQLKIQTYFEDHAQISQEKWEKNNLNSSTHSVTDSKGLFVAHLQKRLFKNEIDAIVHSWKDVPYSLDKRSSYIRVLPREDQRELLFIKKTSLGLIQKKKLILIATSSPRRKLLLEKNLSSLLPRNLQKAQIQIKAMTGNVPTRMEKFIQSDFDGLILAKAGFDRLLDSSRDNMYPTSIRRELSSVRNKLYEHFESLQFMILPLSLFPNAPAQGALVVELRKNEKYVEMFSSLTHFSSETAQHERTLAQIYQPSCISPLGIACLDYNYFFTTHITKDKSLIASAEAPMDNKFLSKFTKKQIEMLMTSNQESYSYMNLNYTPPKDVTISKKNAWPVSHQERASVQSKRIPLPVSPQNLESSPTATFVARIDALPASWMDENIELMYVPAPTTWKALAKKNIWVNACYNSLDPISLASNHKLSGKEGPSKTMRLSHEGSQSFIPSNIIEDFNFIATYKLQFTTLPDSKDLIGKEYFFWRSASLFQAMTDKYPHICELYHACMPGLTSEYIRGKIHDTSKLQLFLSYEDWIASFER